jgi:hypothetical protein
MRFFDYISNKKFDMRNTEPYNVIYDYKLQSEFNFMDKIIFLMFMTVFHIVFSVKFSFLYFKEVLFVVKK